MRALIITGAFEQIGWELFSGLIVMGKNAGRGSVVECVEPDLDHNVASHQSFIRDFVLDNITMTFSKFDMETKIVAPRGWTSLHGMTSLSTEDHTPPREQWTTYRLQMRADGLYVGTWSRLADHAMDRTGKAVVRITILDPATFGLQQSDFFEFDEAENEK